MLNDLQLAVIVVPRVVFAVRIEQQFPQFDQFMQHSQQVGSAAARRIDHAHALQCAQRRLEIALSEILRAALIHELRRRARIDASRLQIVFQALAAHKRHDPARRIVRTRLVPPRHQLFKHLAEHLRIDRDLHIERRALRDREVPFREQTGDHALERAVGDRDRALHVRTPFEAVPVADHLEQTAVQVGNFAAPLLQEGLRVNGSLPGARSQSIKEHIVQPVVIEVFAVRRRTLEERGQVVHRAFETQPTALRQKLNEHQPVEEPLREQPPVPRLRWVARFDLLLDHIERLPIFAEELPRHLLDVPRLLPVRPRPVRLVEQVGRRHPQRRQIDTAQRVRSLHAATIPPEHAHLRLTSRLRLEMYEANAAIVLGRAHEHDLVHFPPVIQGAITNCFAHITQGFTQFVALELRLALDEHDRERVAGREWHDLTHRCAISAIAEARRTLISERVLGIDGPVQLVM